MGISMDTNAGASAGANAGADLRRLLKDVTGLDLAPATVERAVRERMQKTGCADRDAYAPRPGMPEFDALVDLVVVPESWMLRDPRVFEEALRFVQRRLLTRPGHMVRILSLPCAGGEEPYSMALCLARAGIGPEHCRIDALDVSQAAIERARRGRYTRNAFRGTDPDFRARHFIEHDDEYVIAPSARAYVAFEQGNVLALDTIALGGRYDLVFCRNLMIYFDEATQARAAAALHALLADDGLLLSGYAEVPAFCRHGFAPRTLRDTFALRKLEQAAPAGTLPWLRALGSVRGRDGAADVPVLPAAPAFSAAASAGAGAVASVQPAPRERLEEARRHADAGRLREAEQACRDVLVQRPDSADAWFLLGLVSECAGQPQAAERHWRCCVYLDPDHYEALCALALLHEGRGDAVQGDNYRQRAARVFQRRGRVDA
jgi:chemotaxis protein methyltransferase WspC